MAHIVEFRSNVLRDQPECELATRGGAQIIIFPGVRIERHAEPPSDQQAKARRRERGRPKRDRLELPD